ncbi:ATP-binding protein [Lentzea sp. JNUCC 0626]|uniref:ATP-binding protein n=1 Tax=Lentzea sp. JNUCC 0626 TaxID=3367513 RepID=UPI003749B212
MVNDDLLIQARGGTGEAFRQLLEPFERELHAEQAEDLIIVADEMVSNALRHGSTPRAIRLRRQADSLRLEVDDGSTTTAHARTPDFHGGRGLTLIGTLAAAWGQNVRENGKTVWAEFTLMVAVLRRKLPPRRSVGQEWAGY